MSKVNWKIIIIMLFIVTLIGLTFSFVSSEGYLPQEQNKNYTLIVSSNNATSCNLSYITYPDNNIKIFNLPMTKDKQTFYLTISKSNYTQLGTICHGIICTDGIQIETGTDCKDITTTGDVFSNSQSIMIIGQLGLIALFIALGFSFEKSKWKLRSFFFILALIMGIITLNSIRIIAGNSESLTSMGNSGLIIGIVILIFAVVWMLINYTIEVFGYFKRKKLNRWETNEQI